MKTKDDLQRKWQELARVWRDDAARAFEDRHLSKIISCMEKIDRERERFNVAARRDEG